MLYAAVLLSCLASSHHLTPWIVDQTGEEISIMGWASCALDTDSLSIFGSHDACETEVSTWLLPDDGEHQHIRVCVPLARLPMEG